MSSSSKNVLDQSGQVQDYKDRFSLVFQEDIEFSRIFKPQIIEILKRIPLPRNVQDHEGTELDRIDGHDFSLRSEHTSVGARVRRFEFQDYDQFSQDDKERHTMSCDLYFLGYAGPLGDELYSYIVFDGHDFLKYKDTEKIPIVARKRNQEHSLVWFSCYRNYDIIQHCKIYVKYGDIGWKSDRVFRGQCSICGKPVVGINIELPKGTVIHIDCLLR